MPRIGSASALLVAFAFCIASPRGSGAQSLLVANQGDRTVSIIDPSSGRVSATIRENVPGEWGHEIVASSDGKWAYLPIYGNTGVGRPGLNGNKLLVIDVTAHKVAGEIDFDHGVRPHQPVLDPVHNLLYVTTELDDAMTVIDPKSLKIIGEVPTGQKESHMLVLSHDGRFGYTANVGPGTVSVLDMVGRKTIAVIPVAGEVQRIAISRDDRLVFTSDQTQPRLAAIDTATRKVSSWIDLPGTGYGAGATLDGKFLLVTIPAKNEVAVVDLSSLRVVRTVPVARSPQEVLVRPDGKVAYVSCMGSGQVAAIDLPEWKVDKLIDAGKGDDGLGWAQ